jgi:ferredoxin
MGPSSGSSGAAGARPVAAGAHPPAAGVRPSATKNADGKFIGRRTKKPKVLAVITASCSGCAGAPVCQIYCPVDACMLLVPAEDAWPYGRIWVDPLKCVGCWKCIGGGPQDTFLDGCPWDAIRMVATPDWEAAHGPLPY